MTADYADQTKKDLQEVARERDLTISGTKQELIERLEAYDKGSGGKASDSDGGGSGPRPMDLARQAARQLGQLTGRKVEGVSGLDKVDGGWRVTLDVIEVARVPATADVLGCYEVMVDNDGDILGYERATRYVRGAVRGD